MEGDKSNHSCRIHQLRTFTGDIGLYHHCVCNLSDDKGMNALNKKKAEEVPAAPPAPPADVQLLTEIRDLLKEKK